MRDDNDGGVKGLRQSTEEATHGLDPTSGGAESDDWEEILCRHRMLLGAGLNNPVVAKAQGFSVE